MGNEIFKIQKMLKWLGLLVILSLLLFVITKQFPRIKREETLPKVNKTAPKVVRPKKGAVNLAYKNGQSRFSINENVSLIVTVSSNGKNVSGFDWLIRYDSSAFSLEQVIPLNKGFNLFSFKEKNMIIINGSKKVGSEMETVLSNTVVAELVFKPLSKGQYNFSLLEEAGKERTQLVDSNTRILFPKLNSLTIEVN
jgi:hypothetical protein